MGNNLYLGDFNELLEATKTSPSEGHLELVGELVEVIEKQKEIIEKLQDTQCVHTCCVL